jgi:hypothetical protein
MKPLNASAVNQVAQKAKAGGVAADEAGDHA